MIFSENSYGTGVVSTKENKRQRRTKPGATLHVLIVAFQSGKSADGGTESLTQLVERYAGFKITLLTQIESSKTARWRNAGWSVHIRPLPYKPGEKSAPGIWRLFSKLCTHVAWNMGVARFARDQDVDTVHVNDPHALWHCAAGLSLVGIPVIYNIRDTKPSLSRRDRWKWRCAFLFSRCQIVLSREMAEFWRRSLGLTGRQLIAIYSVIDFTRMQPLDDAARRQRRAKLGLSSNFAVGYVASFSEKKAQLKFIHGVGPELRRLNPPVTVHFLGDFEPGTDSYAAECERAAQKLPSPSPLVFRGFIDQVEEWYPALDAVIVATQNEGLARCMIESLACGTPVVSFDVCSAREILEGGLCGLVVRQGDYSALILAIASLSADHALRAAQSRNGILYARQIFTAESNVAKYQAMYEAVASRGSVL